jgi:adenylate cyclase
MDRDRLTEAELAERAGISVDRVRDLVALGVIRPDQDAFHRRDVLQLRVVVDLEEKGIDAEALGAAVAAGELRLGYLESAGRRHPRSGSTFSELGEQIGVPFSTLERMYVAFGLPRPSADELVRAEDAEVVGALRVLFGAGVGEGDVLRLARVWGDSARRVAQNMTHYFHATVEEPFRRRGLGDNEALEAAIAEVGLRVGRSGEDLLGWLFRRHAEVFGNEHLFEHVESALERAGVRARSPRGIEAAVFADLAGYTRLTEESGDAVAAEVAMTLAQFVSEVAARHGGEVVKMLGDGVHLHFGDSGDAIRASLEIARDADERGLPPAHVGVNAGPMIYDEGDYFGRTVNIAARIASRAMADQVFVGEDAARASAPNGFRLVEVGAFELKGISQPVTIFEAIRLDP